MPALPEEMYCSQQICIPPSFPYLLRQYAKAAIRTQPPDLLRWSTAYFRCLSLNLRPPVKPRLEYPISKSHFGLTPGWLRALLQQLQQNLTVPFKVLWDRWIGACLQHENLIEVLCLGAFTDPYAIPWFRFVALCAAHLTESLTQTMILVCEILTEEPEGGCAMIPLEVFTDLYQFLAAIDASVPQHLRNLYFTDSLLSLYREPVVVVKKESVAEVVEEEEEESVEAEEEKEEEVEVGPVEDLTGVVISCPDIAADDYKTEEDFVLQQDEETTEQEQSQLMSGPGETADQARITVKSKRGAGETPEARSKEQLLGTEEYEEIYEEEEEHKVVKREDVMEEERRGSVDTILGYMPPRQRDLDLLEDMEKLKHAQHDEELMGEEEEETMVDYELEQLKELLAGPPGPLDVASEVFETQEEEKKEKEVVEEEEAEEEKGELIYIDAVPGIGPIVPLHLVEVVLKYMHECAHIQHGMVMPRNIRHYNCPPLEVLQK